MLPVKSMRARADNVTDSHGFFICGQVWARTSAARAVRACARPREFLFDFFA